MAVFRYRMQSILDLKQQLEEQARMELAAANAELKEEQDALKALHDRRTEYIRKGQQLEGSGFHAVDLRENANAIRAMDDLIASQLSRVQMAGKKVDRAREALQQVMQERKAQEKLREKAFEAFRKEVLAAESKEADELTGYREGRKRRE